MVVSPGLVSLVLQPLIRVIAPDEIVDLDDDADC